MDKRSVINRTPSRDHSRTRNCIILTLLPAGWHTRPLHVQRVATMSHTSGSSRITLGLRSSVLSAVGGHWVSWRQRLTIPTISRS